VGDGALILVGTPIGNLGDLSPRAVEALDGADVICCEDTRRTGKLLQHAGVAKRRMMVVNQHTEARQVPEVRDLLMAGRRVAVVSDAGMPGVSDPGSRLVEAAVAAGVVVEVVPGPVAAVTALVVSGLDTSRYVFEGFLPRKGRDRAARLSGIATEQRTVVLYEAPHRLDRTLDDLVAACGEARQVAVARELTKLHEEVWRGTLADAVRWVDETGPPGEFVLVVEGAAPPAEATDDEIRAALHDARAEGLSVRDAATRVGGGRQVPPPPPHTPGPPPGPAGGGPGRRRPGGRAPARPPAATPTASPSGRRADRPQIRCLVAISGGRMLIITPVPCSKPAMLVNRGRTCTCQW
jgi:16S rRNA (cytidine1402-2'-O)-methyltransferase